MVTVPFLFALDSIDTALPPNGREVKLSFSILFFFVRSACFFFFFGSPFHLIANSFRTYCLLLALASFVRMDEDEGDEVTHIITLIILIVRIWKFVISHSFIMHYIYNNINNNNNILYAKLCMRMYLSLSLIFARICHFLHVRYRIHQCARKKVVGRYYPIHEMNILFFLSLSTLFYMSFRALCSHIDS